MYKIYLVLKSYIFISFCLVYVPSFHNLKKLFNVKERKDNSGKFKLTQ